jgi:hypothetical protein
MLPEADIGARAVFASGRQANALWSIGTAPAVMVPAGQQAVTGVVPVRWPTLGHGLVVAFLSGGMFAYAASPVALMQALGAGPVGCAGLLALSASGLLAGSLVLPYLARALDRCRIVLGGLVLGAAAGLAMLALAAAGGASLVAVAILLALYTFARSLVVPLATTAAMEPLGHAAGAGFGWLGASQMAAAVLAAAGAGLFGDPLLGMSAMLALFATAALGCGLHAYWPPDTGGRCAGLPVWENGSH